MPEFPIEPWELRAYVEEDPSRTYQQSDPEGCIIGRYCNERLNGTWAQRPEKLIRMTGRVTTREIFSYDNPPWVNDVINGFDDTQFVDEAGNLRLEVAGKEILEKGILP